MQKGSKQTDEAKKKFLTTTVRKWLDIIDDDELLRFFDLCMKDRIKKALEARKVNILKGK